MRRALPRIHAVVAAVTVVALITALPVTAHADEMAADDAAPSAPAAPAVPAPPAAPENPPAVMTHLVPILPVDVSRPALLARSSSALPTSLALFAPAPRDVRLSHGAKVAIIVTAIVVGSLIVLGVVVASRPGHHL